MKKLFTKALALLMVLCLVLPGTAMAASTYYIEVTVSDETGKTVTGESSHYATLQEPLAAAVVDVIHTEYENLETVFARTGLRGIVDSGLDAFAAGKEAWGKYVDKYYDSVQESFKDTLKDVTSTYADLSVNEENVVTWADGKDACAIPSPLPCGHTALAPQVTESAWARARVRLPPAAAVFLMGQR